MNMVMVGPPGSGKGTQAERLAGELRVEHLATGDVLRAEVARRSQLGAQVRDTMARGALVDDELILALMAPRILAATQRAGYLLDGFPRSVQQAEDLMRMGADPDIVISLEVPEPVLVERILRRAQAADRADDTADVITHRLRVFDKSTSPVLGFFKDRGLLRTVAADAAPDIVTTSILDLVHGRATS